MLRALIAYVTASLVLAALTAWAAARAGGSWLAVLIGLSAAQVTFYAVLCIVQTRSIGAMLRLAGTEAGQLIITSTGGDDGQRSWAWADAEKVRAHRTSIPHLRVHLRRGSRRRRVFACPSTVYGIDLDELIAAIEPFMPVTDPQRPRPPARNEQAGTTTFYFNGWQLTARRRRNLRTFWQAPLTLGPAAAGLVLAGYWPGALAVLAPGAALVVVSARRVRATNRLLRIGKNATGRLLLTPDDLTLAGTNVAIPWSHVQGAVLARGDEPRVIGTIACPGQAHADGEHCNFTGRAIKFSIGAKMYATSIDEIAGAFGRHVPVAVSGPEPPPDSGSAPPLAP